MSLRLQIKMAESERDALKAENTRLRQAGDALVTNFTRAAAEARGGGSSDYDAAYNEGRESAFDEAVRVVETAFRAALAASDKSTFREHEEGCDGLSPCQCFPRAVK